MKDHVSVTEFTVLAHVIFKCAFCPCMIVAERQSTYHISTGDHCQCGAWYLVEWNDNTPTILMAHYNNEVSA